MRALSGRAALHAKWLLAALVLALLPLLFLFGPDNYAPRSLKLAWQLGHVLFFGAAAGWAVLAVPRLRGMRWIAAMAWITGISAVAGAGIEFLQGLTGRDSSWADLRLDVMGAVLAAGCLLPSGGRAEHWLRLTVGGGLVLALLALDFRPLAIALIDEQQARRAFPVLSNFAGEFEAGRWEADGRMRIIEDTERHSRVLSIDLEPGKYRGFRLQHFPRDWRGYAEFHVDVYVPAGAPDAITCRIHDIPHDGDNRFVDRFNRRFPVAMGWNHLSIPLADVAAAPQDRCMDLSRIAGFGCFHADLRYATAFRVSDVRLAGSEGRAAIARGAPAQCTHNIIERQLITARASETFTDCDRRPLSETPANLEPQGVLIRGSKIACVEPAVANLTACVSRRDSSSGT